MNRIVMLLVMRRRTMMLMMMMTKMVNMSSWQSSRFNSDVQSFRNFLLTPSLDRWGCLPTTLAVTSKF